MEVVEKKVRFLELIKIVMKKLYIKINIFSYGFWFIRRITSLYNKILKLHVLK